jgi:hypothetical protein
MTEKLEWFSQTSDEPYDRHQYKFVYSNDQSVIFDSWERVQQEWFTTPKLFKSHIEVLDKKEKSQGGFK